MALLKLLVIFLGLNLLSCVLIDDQPYCTLRYRRLCKGKGSHVACQFPSPGPGVSCQNYSKIIFTNSLKHFITHYINRRRQRIASGGEKVRGGAPLPRPQIMMLVTWDRELAHLAQRLADQCEFEHDDCRATVRYPYAGQSVGEVRWRRSSDSEQLIVQRAIRRVFDAWWGERRRVQPSQLTAPFRLEPTGIVWGHFSQLAVWTLRAVGCGAVRYGYDYTRLLLVCDFSHTNMLGQRTINVGPLAPCPGGTVRKPRTSFPLLCAPVRRETSQDEDDRKSDHEDENDYDRKISQTPTTRPTSKRTLDQKYMEIGDQENEDRATTFRAFNNRKTTRQDTGKIQELYEMDRVTLNEKHLWVSRRPSYGKFREDPDKRKEWNQISTYDDTTPEQRNNFGTWMFVPTKHSFLATFCNRSSYKDNGLVSNTGHANGKSMVLEEEPLRHWKQTRKRHQRPGANALLKKPPEKLLPRSSLSSLMIDQDDIDQFFRDTGFNVNWRKQPLPR